jgi:tetratricopeptide (TPR) repeat protein
MEQIPNAGLEDVSASSRRLPAPPTTGSVASDDASALQANLDDARKALGQGDLGAAQQDVERVLEGLSTRKRKGSGQVEDLQAFEGAAQSLLGQILAEREGLGARARNALERAADVYRLIVHREPTSAQAYADYGAALYLLGRREDAERALTQALELGDTSASTGRRLGRLLLADGRAAEAKAVLLRVNAAAPGDIDILSLLGQAERELGHADSALPYLREAAALALQAGDLARSLDLYTAAEDLAPDDAELQLYRGEVLRLCEQPEAAVHAFDQALALAPDLAAAKVAKADTLRVLGDFIPALSLLDEALDTEPHNAWALAIKGDVLRILGNYHEALTFLEASLDEDPTSAWAVGTRGQVFRGLGRHAEARSDLERATNDAPRLAWAWAELSATCYEQGDREPALHAAEQALYLDAEIPLALAVRARCLIDAGRLTEAVGPLTSLLGVEPKPDWVWRDLVVALRAKGDDESARTVVETALAEKVVDAELLILRAELRLASGNAADRAAVVDDLEEYLRTEPTNSDGLLRAGRAYRALGENVRAAEALDLALTLGDEPEILCEKAAVEFELQHYEKVLEALDGLTAPPASADDLWRRGEAARFVGDQKLASRSFKQALEYQPGHLRALRGLVVLNLDRQKLDQAREYASIALEQHPGDSDALTAAALVSIASVDYDNAFQYLARALEHDANNRSALFAYGRSLLETGRFDRAADILSRLRSQGATMGVVFEFLGFALENAAIGALAGEEPQLTGEARSLLGRARDVYEEGMQQHQESFYLQLGRAEMTSILDGADVARAAYDDLVAALEATHGYDRDLIGLLGWCYSRLGRHNEAIRAYVSALSADTRVDGDYLWFDLALATLAAEPADIGLLDYRHARDRCENVPVPRRRGLFQVARNDLVASLIVGCFSNPSIASEVIAEFDLALEDLEQRDTSQPSDPFGNS